MAAVAWVLNLAAELELERPSAWHVGARVQQHLDRFVPVAAQLLGPEDHMLTPHQTLPERLLGAPGRAFCPTPSALRALRTAGATPEVAPSLEILQAANHRRFGLALGAGVRGARFIVDEAELRSTLDERNVPLWLFKKPFGFSGKGQRRIRQQLSADDERWLTAALAHGGVWAEPWVTIEREFAAHGYVNETGQWIIGNVCVQQVDAYRSWQRSTLATPAEVAQFGLNRVLGAAERVASALAAHGYFGPFGVDAFAWRDTNGLTLNALSEINARYSMGWASGMAHVSRGPTGLPLLTPH